MNNFSLLQIHDCPTHQDAFSLIINEKFREIFYGCPDAIGISIQYNEEFKLLSDSQLGDMEDKYLKERPILISFQSNVDLKFFIRWRMGKKQKMLILEVEESHEEDLNTIREFTMDFLLTSIKNGLSGGF
jgi:hypothetical protein